MASLNTVVEAPSAVATAEVEGELVLLNTETGTYYGLNPLGGRILTLADEEEGISLRAVVDRLHGDFPDVERDRLADDVVGFVEEMEGFGLLVVREGRGA